MRFKETHITVKKMVIEVGGEEYLPSVIDGRGGVDSESCVKGGFLFVNV